MSTARLERAQGGAGKWQAAVEDATYPTCYRAYLLLTRVPEEDAEHLERVDTLDEGLHEHLQALGHLTLGHQLEHTEDAHLYIRT